jgi:hypothetical protein
MIVDKMSASGLPNNKYRTTDRLPMSRDIMHQLVCATLTIVRVFGQVPTSEPGRSCVPLVPETRARHQLWKVAEFSAGLCNGCMHDVAVDRISSSLHVRHVLALDRSNELFAC